MQLVIEQLSIDAGFEDRELLEVVYSDLKFGAHVGARVNFESQRSLIMHHRHLNLKIESVTQYVNG